MSSILIPLFLIFYLILAKIRLDWAVMFLIAALPTYLIRFQVFGVPLTLLEAMILISFAVWVFANYRQIYANLRQKDANLRQKVRYPFDVEIILLLFISYAALAIAGFNDSALGIWKAYFFEPILVFILILNVGAYCNTPVRNNKKELNSKALELSSFFVKILWPLAVSALAVSVFAIYQKFTGHFIFNELWAAEETRRVTSFFGYPNAVGLYLGPIVMVMIGWLFLIIARSDKGATRQSRDCFVSFHSARNDSLKLFFIGLTIILSLLSIYFAKSEGALAGVAIGLVIFGLLAGKKIRWATIVLILIMGAGIISYQPVRDYAIKKITLTDLSGEIRKQQWKETWQMMTNSPTRFIFGAGLANYQNAIKPYHQEGIFFNKDNDPEFHRHVVWNEEYKKSHWQPVEIYLYPHNIFLNFWTEIGLAGMLLFIWIIGKYFYIGLKTIVNRQPARNALHIKAGGSSIENSCSKNKYLILGLIGAMAVIVVHGIVDVPYFKNDLAVMFWVLLVMISMLNLEKPLQNYHRRERDPAYNNK